MYAPKHKFYNPLAPYFPFVYIYVFFTHFFTRSNVILDLLEKEGNYISAPRPKSRGARCSRVCVPAKSKSRRACLRPNS